MLDVVGTPSDPSLRERGQHLQGWVDSGAHRRDANRGQGLRGRRRGPDHGRLVAARARRGLQARPRDRRSWTRIQGMHGLRQRAQQPRRPPRQRLPGRLVRLPAQGPARAPRAAGEGQLLTHLLRARQPHHVPQRAARVAYRRRSATPSTELYQDQRLHRAPWSSSGASTPSATARSAALSVPPHHWINRPTFQQVVEVQGHRPR